MDSPPPIFVDVPTLLESSRPRQRMAWFSYFAAAATLAVLFMVFLSDHSTSSQQTIETVSSLVMIILLAAMSMANYLQVRGQRNEQAQIEAAEELVQLRRWSQAAFLLQSLLSRPTRSLIARLQALVYFSSVLARFHRFEDVLTISDHLLETIPLDAPAVHMVKLTRTMALLREDRLFDADRAIGDLRRSPQAAQSAGLALIELYRDVKTGHPAEALEILGQRGDLIRLQLGHRVADAHVLAAKAYDLLNQTENARTAYQTATLLAPAMELHRRYPETADLARKYTPASAPAEVIG